MPQIHVILNNHSQQIAIQFCNRLNGLLSASKDGSTHKSCESCIKVCSLDIRVNVNIVVLRLSHKKEVMVELSD